VRGNRDAIGRRQHAADVVSATGTYYPSTEPRSRNTTLTLVATDQRLDPLQLRSIARQVHASMARAIQPFHARWDGDVLYACSTQSVDDTALDEVSLGVVASELAWDAVLACYDQ
jgi:L-aminopeptidase/D-esterase-like protein